MDEPIAQVVPRFMLLARVIVTVVGGATHWARLSAISRSRIAVSMRDSLKPGARVTIGFRFHLDDGGDLTETLAAQVIWQAGQHMGLEFTAPLAVGSTTAEAAPLLTSYLVKMETGQWDGPIGPFFRYAHDPRRVPEAVRDEEVFKEVDPS